MESIRLYSFFNYLLLFIYKKIFVFLLSLPAGIFFNVFSVFLLSLLISSIHFLHSSRLSAVLIFLYQAEVYPFVFYPLWTLSSRGLCVWQLCSKFHKIHVYIEPLGLLEGIALLWSWFTVRYLVPIHFWESQRKVMILVLPWLWAFVSILFLSFPRTVLHLIEWRSPHMPLPV